MDGFFVDSMGGKKFAGSSVVPPRKGLRLSEVVRLNGGSVSRMIIGAHGVYDSVGW